MRLFFIKRLMILICLCFALFISCEARIDGSLAADGSASLTVNMSLYTRMAALIQNLFNAAGQQGNVLDSSSVARSMSSAPGIASVTLRNTSPAAISGQVQISQIGDFLSAAAASNEAARGERGFITFERRGTGGRCGINIDRNNGETILALLSPQITDYLNALMAPVVTKEEISKEEYLELITAFYNRNITDEISRSNIRASIDFPGNVTGSAGGTFSGRRAVFTIPLLDLLVLETPIRYEVTWN